MTYLQPFGKDVSRTNVVSISLRPELSKVSVLPTKRPKPQFEIFALHKQTSSSASCNSKVIGTIEVTASSTDERSAESCRGK